MIIFYCIPNCTTCANARNWLVREGIQYTEYNLKKQPPSKEELVYWMEQSKLPIKSFFNTNGKSYREKGLKDKVAELTTEAAAALLSADGMLIKRPLAVTNKQCTIGFKEENYQKKWKRRADQMSEIRYSDKGLWIEKENGSYRIGISEQGQDDIGEVAFVELPANQSTIKTGDSLLNVEGAKAVTDLESPLTGTVIRFNKKLEDEPENLNTPEKENNWIVELTDVDEAVFAALSEHI